MIHGLRHVEIAVPDLSVADAFVTAFGLASESSDDGLTATSPGRAGSEIVFVEGPVKRLHGLAFSLGATSVDEAVATLRDRGVDAVDEVDDGVQVTDPDGNKVRLLAGDAGTTRPIVGPRVNGGSTVARLNERFWQHAKDDPSPFRLGHSLVFSPQPEAMERFYIDVLGLGLSDRIVGKVSFLNAGPGDHHVFGFIRSTHPGLHHVSFEVAGIDSIAATTERLEAAGYDKGWGIGRHSVGSNLFHYTADPWGSWFEVFCDLDVIDDTWEPGDWEAAPHIWGTPPPDDFIVNREPA